MVVFHVSTFILQLHLLGGFYYWQRMRKDSKGRYQCVHWCKNMLGPKSEEKNMAKADAKLEQSPLTSFSSTIFVPVLFIILVPAIAVPILIIKPIKPAHQTGTVMLLAEYLLLNKTSIKRPANFCES